MNAHTTVDPPSSVDPPASVDPRATGELDRLIGERLRQLRVDRGVSQPALAAQLGVTFQQVQKYERGVNRLSFVRLVEIARVLGISLRDIYGPIVMDEPAEDAPAPRQGALAELIEMLTPLDLRDVHRLEGDARALIELLKVRRDGR